VSSNTWFSAAGSPPFFEPLTYWDQGFYIGNFFEYGNKASDKGWIYDANFGWIFVATSAGSNSTSLYDTMNTQTLSIWAFTDVFGNGEWVFFASSLIYTNAIFFLPSNVNTNVGTWQSGHGIQVYRNDLGSFWGLLRNSDGVIFYTETTNFDGNYVATPTIDDIDGDGVPNASDDTPAIRLRGIRQSSGSILWIVYVIFTKTSLTNANIHVSGGSQFSGSLSDTDTLTAQNSYKIGNFSANNISTKINSYTNYAYFRFPVSSDNGSSYTDSQTIESIQVLIPTVGPNNGDEGSTYKYFYQNL
jgi:hypothetical protein